MKRYIAYFDFLGYKNFILNNDTDYIREHINFILQGIEASLGQNKWTTTNQGSMIADISNSKINCLNISDTVIFWTNDDSLASFKELLKISFDFNWRETCYSFPVRGAIVYDEIDIIHGYQKSKKGGTYNVNSIYGKGIVNAHLKAEDLNIASCVIDNSIVEKIKEFGEVEDILGDYAMKYAVPYKKCESKESEYLLTFYINTKINEEDRKEYDEAIESRKNGIIDAFKSDNKGMNERAGILLKNTIDFLEIMKEE
jgi:rRNA processing protein Gar1